MYSRTITNPETRGNIRASHSLHSVQNTRNTQNIPVKSFSDRSAYEHFGTMGKSNNQENSSEISVNAIQEYTASEENISVQNKGDVPMLEQAMEDTLSENNNTDMLPVLSEKKMGSERNESLFSDIARLWSHIGSDAILLLVAGAIVFFGNKEADDKLTPLALLAIMLL